MRSAFFTTLLLSILFLTGLQTLTAQAQTQSDEQAVSDARKDLSFTQLRDERSELLAEIPRLRAERDRILSQIRNLEAEEQDINSRLRRAPVTPVQDMETLQKREELRRLQNEKAFVEKDIERTIRRIEADIERAKADEAKGEEVASFLADMEDRISEERLRGQSHIEDIESRIRVATAEVEISESRVTVQTADLNALLEDIKARKKTANESLAKTETALQAKVDRQFEVENDINLLLIPQTAENRFKLYITIAFASLVGVVIIGFFFMAFTDETVRRAIFSGQAGIQFLTLFSLVIAIILFGMTGILEDKELAALLGGISGYILGRVTPNA